MAFHSRMQEDISLIEAGLVRTRIFLQGYVSGKRVRWPSAPAVFHH